MVGTPSVGFVKMDNFALKSHIPVTMHHTLMLYEG